MPTNEERREVAARLRELADENTVTATDYFVREIFKELGVEPPATSSYPTLGDLEAYDQAFLYRLADLIEPEPERTCHNIHPDVFQCSECYAMDDDWVRPNFCPICGAKVMEANDAD